MHVCGCVHATRVRKDSLKPSIFPGKSNENYWREWITLREHAFSCTHALKSNREKETQQIYLILNNKKKTIKIECSVIIKVSFQVTDCETKASSNVVIIQCCPHFYQVCLMIINQLLSRSCLSVRLPRPSPCCIIPPSNCTFFKFQV